MAWGLNIEGVTGQGVETEGETKGEGLRERVVHWREEEGRRAGRRAGGREGQT